MANSNTLARLVVKMEAETAGYKRDLDKAQALNERYKKQAQSSLSFVKTAFVGVVAAMSVAQVNQFYQENADGIDKLAKNADKIGITTEALQGLRHAGELGGVAVETMDKSLEKMNKNVSEAATGTGTAVDALDELGLSAKQLNALSADQKMMIIADAMQEVDNKADQTRLAMDLFGKSGGDLTNVLAGGSESIRGATLELDEFGVSITRVDASQVEAANDEFTRVHSLLGSVGQKMAVETAPLLGALANKFLGAAKESGGMGNVTQTAIQYITEGTGYAMNAVHGLKVVFLGVRLAVAEVVNQILKIPLAAASLGESVADKLGFDSAGLQRVKDFGDSFKGTLQTMRDDLQNATLEPLPHDQVVAFVNDIYVKSEAAALAKVSDGGGLGAMLIGDGLAVDPASGSKVDTEEKELTELEKLQAAHLQEKERAEYASQLKLLQFQELTTAGKIGLAVSEGSSLLSIAGESSEKMFKLSQKVGIANALISTYQGIAAGVKLGWPLAVPAVAWATLNGFKQVSAIKSQTLDSSSSVSSISSSLSSDITTDISSADVDTETTEESTEESQTQIVIYGDIWGMESVQDKIVEAVAAASSTNQLVVRDQSGRITLEAA